MSVHSRTVRALQVFRQQESFLQQHDRNQPGRKSLEWGCSGPIIMPCDVSMVQSPPAAVWGPCRSLLQACWLPQSLAMLQTLPHTLEPVQRPVKLLQLIQKLLRIPQRPRTACIRTLWGLWWWTPGEKWLLGSALGAWLSKQLAGLGRLPCTPAGAGPQMPALTGAGEHLILLFLGLEPQTLRMRSRGVRADTLCSLSACAGLLHLPV